MHQEYVSGQLPSKCFVDISDKREIKPCTNIHILDKIDPANIVSLIVWPINASV